MDKIFVKDFVKKIEIGAFQTERDCTQRVRFNIALEILPRGSKLTDDVDQILSYETIMTAIDLELKLQRFNLLETLAEQIAQRCLNEKNAYKVSVTIEKLDRIPGALGISIVRRKDEQVESKINKSYYEDSKLANISLVHFSTRAVESVELNNWLIHLIETNTPVLVLFDPASVSSTINLTSIAKRNINLLSIDQMSWKFSSIDERLRIVSSKSELDWIFENNEVALFCPSKFVSWTISQPPLCDGSSENFSLWLAKAMNIKFISFIRSSTERLEKVEDVEGLRIKYFTMKEWKKF